VRGQGRKCKKEIYTRMEGEERSSKNTSGARNEEKALDAIKALEEEVTAAQAEASQSTPSPGKIIYHYCDIGTPAQAQESAENFIERESRLDVLINNAGLLADNAVLNDIIKVNHFGTLQFILSLLPLLIKTAKTEADVRIVTVNSSAHTLTRANNPDIKFRNWEDYNADYSKDLSPAFSKYCVSKLAGMLAHKALQRRLIASSEADGVPPSNIITCIAVHPGAVNTFSHRIPLRMLCEPIVNLFFVSPDVGALNSCFAAASAEVATDKKKYQGAFLRPVGKVKEVSKIAANEALQDELWESTEKILKEWPETVAQ